MIVIYSPEEYKRAVELWQRLFDVVSERSNQQATSTDDICVAVLTNGEGSPDHGTTPQVMTLMSYSDYHGSCCDRANIRELDGTPGVDTDEDSSSGYARVTLGELPGADDDEVSDRLDWLEHLVKMIERLEDYPLLCDETHSEMVEELAEEAWDSWLSHDLTSDVTDALNGREGDYELEDFGVTEEQLKEMFWGYETSTGEFANCESATSVVFPYQDEATAHIVNEILKAWMAPVLNVDQLELTEVA